MCSHCHRGTYYAERDCVAIVVLISSASLSPLLLLIVPLPICGLSSQPHIQSSLPNVHALVCHLISTTIYGLLEERLAKGYKCTQVDQR